LDSGGARGGIISRENTISTEQKTLNPIQNPDVFKISSDDFARLSLC
jgi:hypothetical protein